jgi:uncharacterized membrane protein (DUF373 family)
VIAVLREVIHLCCMTTAFLCGIAVVTIALAIVANKLSDPQAWTAAVFFAAIGVASWIAGNAARI